MRSAARIPILLLCLLSVLTGAASAQTAAVAGPSTADKARILTYIHSNWDVLARSMSSCKSVVDSKVTTTPILYLPVGMETPPEVLSMEKECKVEVRALPRKIAHMGDVTVAEVPQEGLLYLPHPYVVPGGRFNEMYGWDSYFIVLGLIEDKRTDLARDMIENFFFEIENYGSVLNANRTYYLTRSQPPFLTSMIRDLYEHPAGKPVTRAWLARAYGYAKQDYTVWTSAPHLAGDTGLARYSDLGNGPVPEMADDSAYYTDVIRWLLAHPNVKAGYLIDGPQNPTPQEAEDLSKTSCDVRISKVCAGAWVDGHRLTAAFYRGDRAMRESGFDTSFRFGPFSGSTDHYAPVCLNSLLYKYERDMEHFALLLGRNAEAATWRRRAAARKATINRLMWNPKKGMFFDYDFVNAQQSTYNYATTFYPMWAGLATHEQAAELRLHLPLLERAGGLATSDFDSGTQWDLPFGWAPTTWLTVKGLADYGFSPDATRIATNFSQTVLENFLRDGTIREKYNVVSGSANVEVATGYKSNVVGFGWTNGVYLEMNRLLADAARRLSAASLYRNFDPEPVAYQSRIAFVPPRNHSRSHRRDRRKNPSPILSTRTDQRAMPQL
ncbi:MAG: trehalase family glycosidase [Edaphobacter sp.]|uniref:trehalase family glycosidase n=1 Tax=Edaphobacter sp. TaxID=1934404 RepID=UPI002390567D|nr:trehalase family glycosidase [Edaphobacter sp.]MDE1176070.1 trehalase family glycosidase [Edaphobacter sp.]